MGSETFDIQLGMAVFGSDKERLGVITEIAGFGSTLIPDSARKESHGSVTQASTGTGYFKVGREEVMGEGAKELCVPFHRIQQISSASGVILNDVAIVKAEQEKPQDQGWRPWRPGRRSS